MIRWVVPAAAVASLLALGGWAHLPVEPLPQGVRADRVVVHKAARVLELYDGARRLRSYSISLGWEPRGAKREEGDGKTPEGRYVVDFRKADSSFHRALHVSYPSPREAAAARARGASAGGLIMIHGLPNGRAYLGRLHLFDDWTLGCIAVTNPEIEEIWRVVPDGTPIEILP